MKFSVSQKHFQENRLLVTEEGPFSPVFKVWLCKQMGFQDSSVGKESAHKQESPVQFLGRKICWRTDRLPTPVFLGFPCGSADKESACNVGDLGSIPGLGRSPGERKGYPLQNSGLENSIDCIVRGVAKSQTRLSDFHFRFLYPGTVNPPDTKSGTSSLSWTPRLPSAL